MFFLFLSTEQLAKNGDIKSFPDYTKNLMQNLHVDQVKNINNKEKPKFNRTETPKHTDQTVQE